MSKKTFTYTQQLYEVEVVERTDSKVSAKVNDQPFRADIEKIDENLYVILHNHHRLRAHIARTKTQIYVHIHGENYVFEKNEGGGSRRRSAERGSDEHTVSAPMPGKILKMLVKDGQAVSKNATLFILEAMKMENEVKAPRDGVVKKIHFHENDLVGVGSIILELE